MRVITVRMSDALHAGMKELAFEKRLNINQLVIQLIRRAVLENDRAATVLRREEGPEEWMQT